MDLIVLQSPERYKIKAASHLTGIIHKVANLRVFIPSVVSCHRIMGGELEVLVAPPGRHARHDTPCDHGVRRARPSVQTKVADVQVGQVQVRHPNPGAKHMWIKAPASALSVYLLRVHKAFVIWLTDTFGSVDLFLPIP